MSQQRVPLPLSIVVAFRFDLPFFQSVVRFRKIQILVLSYGSHHPYNLVAGHFLRQDFFFPGV